MTFKLKFSIFAMFALAVAFLFADPKIAFSSPLQGCASGYYCIGTTQLDTYYKYVGGVNTGGLDWRALNSCFNLIYGFNHYLRLEIAGT